MTEYSEASDAVLAARWALAGRVRDELVRAGLPASFDDAQGMIVGAVIEVDAGDDEAGGVFVRWDASADLADLAADSVGTGQIDHPSIAHSALVSEAMRDAMLTILHSAGFNSVVVDDELRPFALEVVTA